MVHTDLGPVALKTGEAVSATLIEGPDQDWADRLLPALVHKGEPYNWENSVLLRESVSVKPRFYVLHRDGSLVANVATFEVGCVGLLAHVYTAPSERRKGASSKLLDITIADAKARGCRALYLSSEYNKPPHIMYASKGFQVLEPGSEHMALFLGTTAEQLDHDWFSPQELVTETLDWSHWVASAPLFTGDFPGLIRSVPGKVIGRGNPEDGLLRLLNRAALDGSVPAVSLVGASNGAVFGFAAWAELADELGVCVDVYCHPSAWGEAAALLQLLPLPPRLQHHRQVAFVDSLRDADKRDVLIKAGFAQASSADAARLRNAIKTPPLPSSTEVYVAERGQ